MPLGPRPSSNRTATPGDSSWQTYARRWLLSYGLRVETLLATLILVLAFITVVIVLFGSITALPTGPPPEGSETGASSSNGILELGNLLVNVGIVLAVGLGVLLTVHGIVELLTAVQTTLGNDRRKSRAYTGIRTLQTVTAIGFIGPILTGVTLSQLGVIDEEPSTILILFLLLTGLVMLGSVFLHGIVRVIRSHA